MSPAKGRRGRRRAGRPAPGPGARGYRLGVLLLRLFTGAFFLDAVHFKLFAEGYSLAENYAWFRDHAFPEIAGAAIADPPRVLGWRLDFYADFLRDAVVPHADLLAPLVLGAEVLLGASLLLGAGVRLSAALGFVMMLLFSLAKEAGGVYLLTTRSANWPVTLLLLFLCLAAAGRTWGLDARLSRRWPPWIS